MIENATGNLLQADAEALVNTVNTVGVMGKGIALQFRQAYPENYKAYRRACEHGEVAPGRMFVFRVGALSRPRFIINFPTKRHWRGKTRLQDIDDGLRDLVEVVRRENILSIAIPPLGCGSGGLDWEVVRPRIEAAFAKLPDVQVILYSPGATPLPEAMKVATEPPQMTLSRAALIGLMENYALPGYRLTELEIQKLVYFLQTAGEPLRIDFVKYHYGPYAEVLNHVLQRLEGHFIRGYGDRTRGRDASIRLLPGAAGDAMEIIEEHPETHERLRRVARLIDGYEFPYGMELLATVHWVIKEDPGLRDDLPGVIDGVQAWSTRKRNVLRPEHIELAWNRLRDHGWL